MNYTVSRVVAVSPQLRLVEDNPASLSLLDICKQVCTKKNVLYDEPLTKYYDRLALIQVRFIVVYARFSTSSVVICAPFYILWRRHEVEKLVIKF